MTTFNEHVLKWLQTEHPHRNAVKVTSVSGYGTDWAGDTESGFYGRFDVTIWYTIASGDDLLFEVNGDDLGSLWDWVVNVFPEDGE